MGRKEGHAKLSLEIACNIAIERGGLCLSDKYINDQSPLLWCCAMGHEWFARLANIKRKNSWCPQCAPNCRQSIEEAKQIAHDRNGDCLSKKYINNNSPLLWRCSIGHEWYSPFASIKNSGTWCPQCQFNRRLTLEDAKQIAISRGGECLSENFDNSKSILLWRCGKGHEWYARFHSIKNLNSWCPYCAGYRITLEDVKQIAINKGGECLSQEYINSYTPLIWRCNKGHEWSAKLHGIKNLNTWCPKCAGNKRLTLEEANQIASIKNGPPSKNRKPNFLKTLDHPRGLELDIPYYHYGFAIEVQGEQHDKYIKFFHRDDPKNFIRQQERDQLKKELCEENQIVLSVT